MSSRSTRFSGSPPSDLHSTRKCPAAAFSFLFVPTEIGRIPKHSQLSAPRKVEPYSRSLACGASPHHPPKYFYLCYSMTVSILPLVTSFLLTCASTKFIFICVDILARAPPCSRPFLIASWCVERFILHALLGPSPTMQTLNSAAVMTSLNLLWCLCLANRYRYRVISV